MIRSGAPRDERSYGVRHPGACDFDGNTIVCRHRRLSDPCPRLYLDMRDLRGFEKCTDYDKLNKGLGLSAMAIPDVHEDTATMGAMAVMRLIDRNGLNPRDIGRLYLGTESALDGAKPTATYIVEMLTQRYASRFGEDCFQNCDVVDMTFACIGAVDALHTTLDWCAGSSPEDERMGIVVYSDNEYELGSPGEYTQGAGGGALLIRRNPRLLTIPDCWGISTSPAHDFFKPRREMSIRALMGNVLDLARETGANLRKGILDRMMRHLPDSTLRRLGIFAHGEERISIHRDEPVFDGQYSNRCYQNAVRDAFVDFQRRATRIGRYDADGDPRFTEQWDRIIMHLPYAFQAKRMFPAVFHKDRQGTEAWAEVEAEVGPAPVRERAWMMRHGTRRWIGTVVPSRRPRHTVPSTSNASRRDSVRAVSSGTNTPVRSSWR